MKTLIKNFLLACFTLTLFVGCRKEADTDEEIRQMIVGTWWVDLGKSCTFCGKNTRIIEFSENGLYRQMEIQGSIDDWYSLDTTGGNLQIDGIVVEYLPSFEDSVYYEINNEVIIKHYPQSSFTLEMTVKRLNNKELKLIYSNEEEETFKRVEK